MPVSTVITSFSYKPGNAMLPEAVPFQFFSASDLTVKHIDAAGVRTALTSAAFVIAGDGLSKTGTIRATGVWPIDDLFLIERNTERVQKANIKPHEPIPAIGVTQQLDRTILVVQEQDSANTDTASRALMALPGQELGSIDKLDLPGKLIGGDALGNPIPVSVRDSGGIDTLATLVDPAAAGRVVAFRRTAATPVRSIDAKARDVVSVNDYGGDGEPADWTAAINAAILDLVERDGGEVFFGERSTPYQVNGPVLIPSKIRINLNGQVLNGKGGDSYPDAMFMTAYLDGDALVSNLASADEQYVVEDSRIGNGLINNAGRVFDLFNFCHGCVLEDMKLTGNRQAWLARRCFYTRYTGIMAIGNSDPFIPTYHFLEQANATYLERLSATTAWGYHFEGGCTAVTMNTCSFEGGQRGIAVTGDMLGFQIVGMYAEAVQGRLFDFRNAAVVRWDVKSLYASFVDILIDDGGPGSAALVIGVWDQSNGVYNVGVSMGGFLYRGIFAVSAPGNRMRFELFSTMQGQIAPPLNYIFSPLTNLSYVDAFSGNSAADVRAKARLYAGVIDFIRTGDVGDPFPGTIPYTTSILPVGDAVNLTIDTRINWRPNSLSARFVLNVSDNVGVEKIAGEIFGDIVKRADGSSKTVTASSYIAPDNGVSFLRLVIGPINNSNGAASRTGVVEISS